MPVFDNLSLISILLMAVQFFIVVSVVIRVILTRHPPGSSFAWILLTVVLPYVGFFLYLMLGERPIGRLRARLLRHATHYWGRLSQVRSPPLGPLPYHLVRHRTYIHLASKLAGMPVMGGSAVSLKASAAETIAALQKDIQNARYSIEMEFYIWEEGGSVDVIIDALFAARRRGVSVRLLVDDFGSRNFLRSNARRDLEAAGVEIASAMPMRLLQLFDLQRADIRLHRKTVVIDGSIAYTGSFNMIEPHSYAEAKVIGSWIDAMVRIEGPGAKMLEAVWRFDWALQPDGTPLDFDGDFSQMRIPSMGSATLVAVPSGPYQSGDRNLLLILETISHAEHSLSITTPYFIPTESVVSALLNAALRGVDVRLIVPIEADNAFVNWAMRRYFDDLLQGGIRILRYQGGLLHTKSIVVDDEFAVFGTLNIDNRSLHLNFELMMVIFDDEFVASLKQLHRTYEAKCIEVSPQEWRQRPLSNRLKEGVLTSSHRFYKWKGAATGAFPFRYLLSVGLPAVSLFFVGLRRIFFNVFHILHASALRLSDFCYENLFTFINRSRRLHPAAKLFSGSALCCLHSLAETPFIRAFQPKFALNPTPQDDHANQHNGCEENPSNQRQEKNDQADNDGNCC